MAVLMAPGAVRMPPGCEPWAKKCAVESARGAKILFLTPASVGANWFAENVHRHALVLGLQGRIHFDPANPTWGYPKDCALLGYSNTRLIKDEELYNVWNWRQA